jgi:hypothetical protein
MSTRPKGEGPPSSPRHEWADMARSLRRYRLAEAPATWEQEFNAQVGRVIALFADKETPLVHWLPVASAIALEILATATPVQLGSFRSNLPYLPSGRTGKLPLPAQTRKALAKVHNDAAKLSRSLQAAILDPVMEAALLGGFTIPVALRNDPRIASPDGRQAVVREAVDAMATTDRTGLAGVRLKLVGQIHAIQSVQEAASAGLAMLDGRQFKGRSPKTPGRIPSLLILITAQQFAPPPTLGAGVGEWGSAVEDFVVQQVESAGLPEVDREFLHDNLPA